MQCAEGSLIITYPYHGGVLFATFSMEKSYGCMLVSSNIIRVQCTLGWIHFWQIHVGPSASVHSEMNTLWASAARFARDRRPSAFGPSACRRWASGLYCACTQNIVYPCIHREIAALNCQLCRTWGCILQLSASLKSQWCVKLIYPCLHREIFPKIDVHFWRIHVGPPASVHSEMNTLWDSCIWLLCTRFKHRGVYLFRCVNHTDLLPAGLQRGQ